MNLLMTTINRTETTSNPSKLSSFFVQTSKIRVALKCLQICLFKYISETRLKHDKLNNFCEYKAFFVRFYTANRLVAEKVRRFGFKMFFAGIIFFKKRIDIFILYYFNLTFITYTLGTKLMFPYLSIRCIASVFISGRA